MAAQPLIDLGGGLLARVVGGVRIGQIRADRLAFGEVDAPERAHPPEDPRLGLGECPVSVFVGVVAFAGRSDVDLDGLAPWA